MTYEVVDDIAPGIFRSYDIRGVVGESLNANVMYTLGRAYAMSVVNKGVTQVVLGYDGRLSSPEFSQALIAGIISRGVDVVCVGRVPTPLVYFATAHSADQTGIMLTGSHNPANYNGIKMVVQGKALASAEIQALAQTVDDGTVSSTPGQVIEQLFEQRYIADVVEKIHLERPLKIVIDCGNGAAGELAPKLFTALGCEVTSLFCEIDGRFPNHHPDPAEPENLVDLIAAVKAQGADIGLAFDGDGDRLGVVTNEGTIIWPDRQMMLFAKDVLSRCPGAQIVYDVKCSKHLTSVIEAAGGVPLMWKTGHSLIKNKMRELGSPLSGELSGHIFFKERWYGFDDALYTGARLLEILSQHAESAEVIFSQQPNSFNTPELKLPIPEEKKADFMQQLLARADFNTATINTIDGLRVDFADGWGLIRPSNTTPILTVRFEADTEEALQRIYDAFKGLVNAIDASLTFPLLAR